MHITHLCPGTAPYGGLGIQQMADGDLEELLAVIHGPEYFISILCCHELKFLCILLKKYYFCEFCINSAKYTSGLGHLLLDLSRLK